MEKYKWVGENFSFTIRECSILLTINYDRIVSMHKALRGYTV